MSSGINDVDGNLEKQLDEVKALQAIYAEDFQLLEKETSWFPHFKLSLRPERDNDDWCEHVRVHMIIQYNEGYPYRIPKIELENVKGISLEKIETLKNDLVQLAKTKVGEVMVLNLALHLQDSLRQFNTKKPKSFHEEMLWNQQIQQKFKDSEEQKKLANNRLQEEKFNKILEDKVRKRKNYIRKQINEVPESLTRTESLEIDKSIQSGEVKIKEDIKNKYHFLEDSDSQDEEKIELRKQYRWALNTQRFQNEFEVIEFLGQGGFGNVIKVKNKMDTRHYAIKIIHSNVKHFKNITTEVKLLSRLNHENIVRYYNSWMEVYQTSSEGSIASSESEEIYDDEEKSYDLSDVYFEKSDGQEENEDDNDEDDNEELIFEDEARFLYIQMEYCEKKTLRLYIDKNPNKNIDEIWRLFREIVDALVYIHGQGIIHRDLKPGNIFLDSQDQIKIGDFGLATTRRAKDLQDKSGICMPDSIQSLGFTGSLTLNIGTSYYISPELKTERGKYDQKVDIYSLGIIFFEMNYPPFQTLSERHEILTNLNNANVIFPDDFDENLVTQKTIIKKLLNHDPEVRLTSKELIHEFLQRLTIEDTKFNTVVESATANPLSKTFKYIVKSLFDQKYDEVCDVMYEDEGNRLNKFYNQKNILLQSKVQEILVSLFRLHGMVRIQTPLLMPQNKVHELSSDSPMTVMDQQGQLLCLPNNLRVPFARYVKRKRIQNLKCYNIDRVFHVKLPGLQPKEVIECSVDIVTPSKESSFPEGELLYILENVINKFPILYEKNCTFIVNHALLLRSFLLHCNIEEEQHIEFFKMVERQGDNKKSMRNILKSFHVADHNIDFSLKLLNKEEPLENIRKSLEFLLKSSRKISDLAYRGIDQLEKVLQYCEMFGITSTLKFQLGCLQKAYHFSGIFFQMKLKYYKEAPNGKKRFIQHTIASGGNYAQLVQKFKSSSQTANLPTIQPNVVGALIAFDVLVHILYEEKYEIPNKSDYLICSMEEKVNPKQRFQRALKYWDKNISGTLLYDTQESWEKIKKICENEVISQAVVMKDSSVKTYDMFDNSQGKSQRKKKQTKGDGFSENPIENDPAAKSNDFHFKFVHINHKKVHGNSKIETAICSKLEGSLKWAPLNGSTIQVIAADLSKEVLDEIVFTNNLSCDRKNSSAKNCKSKDKQLTREVNESIKKLKNDNCGDCIILYSKQSDTYKIL
ncbi:eIF-2-alpha kinase GCN2-like [Octopus vulgaris]|uniref:non-specific serine/threonine protein kinase n=1 Tax=Octopus vulgaris TaxID=6645 RepID=A0AA36FCX1_OCTVU|nr:eIF-2-alpha kinase GCN2-like [Octopus vulgaris]